MRYSRLGNSGLVVSRLAFGVMTFGQGKGAMASVSKTGERDAEAMVQRSLEAGINFFDAADSYASGQSEVFLGKALGARRKDVIISTKVGFRSGEALIHAGASCAHLVSGTEASLRRLGTDYIDLLSIHKPDPFTPYEETARALDNLVQRGLVRYVGYSNLSAWQSAKFIGIQERYNYSRFIAAQMYYSLVGRDLEHEVVPFCEDAGVGIVVWSPLAGGFLTGRYSGQDSANGKGRLESFDFLPTDRKKSAALIEKMKIIANRHRGTVAQVALGWLLAKPYVTSILLGASRMSQLEDNLGALELGLSPEEIAELDQETAAPVPYPNWFQQRTVDVTMRDALQQGLPARPSEVKV